MIITSNINFIKFLDRAGPTSSKSSSVRSSTSRKGNVKIFDEVKNDNHLERCGFEYGGIYAYKCTNEPHPKFEF